MPWGLIRWQKNIEKKLKPGDEVTVKADWSSTPLAGHVIEVTEWNRGHYNLLQEAKLFEKHCFLFAPDQTEIENKWMKQKNLYPAMAREIFEAMYARFTENDTPDLIDLTLDSDPETDNNERVENEPDPLNISTEDDQDLGLDLSDDEESDKLANEKRRSFDQDKKSEDRMITNLLLEDLGGDSSEDEAKEGTELKQKRVQKRKRESLEILARLETYRKNLEKRRRKLNDQLVKYKADEQIEQFETAIEMDNKYFCTICKISMKKELQTVHEFLHKPIDFC